MSLCVLNVQNRDYSKGEVLSILNDVSFKHHILSGNQHWYSAGTSLETLGKGFEVIGKSIAFLLGAAQLANDAKSVYNGKYEEVETDKTYGGIKLLELSATPTSGSLTGTREFNAFQLPHGEKYSGVEVTKVINELKADGWNWFVSNKNDIVSDFASHKFVNAEVPTSDNHGWWEHAILDATQSELTPPAPAAPAVMELPYMGELQVLHAEYADSVVYADDYA